MLRDFHPFLKDANVVRRLREVAFRLEPSNKTVILLGPVLKIPPELEKEITVVDFELPTAAQLQAMLDSIVETLGPQRPGRGQPRQTPARPPRPGLPGPDRQRRPAMPSPRPSSRPTAPSTAAPSKP